MRVCAETVRCGYRAHVSSTPIVTQVTPWAALFQRRAVRLYFLVCAITAGLTSLQPLLSVMGAELALILGLVLPIFAAPMAARVVVHGREHALSSEIILKYAVGVSLVGLAICLLAAIASGFIRGFCDPLAGSLFMVLGPLAGVLLAAVAGVFAGALSTRPRLGTFFAVMIPLGSIALGVSRFVTTPAIFAYGHFAGYFPGSLYDPDIAITDAYLTLRVATVLLFVVFTLAFWIAFDGQRISLAQARRSPWSLLLVLVLSAVLCVMEAYGPELGHRSTRESIAAELGGRLRGTQCDLLYPRELTHEQAARILEDCDFRIDQASRVLGVTQRGRITAFFFRDAEEKQRLMGASNTYIAKPWRNEVYLQLGEWPHAVLFHELVHVVAANVGTGPFRVSGRLGGLLPSPGIVEGVAVAVAWDEREDLTPHQWARALVEVGHAPSIAETEGLGFLLQPASRAYTASGSFVRWILETRGNATVRRLYETGSYEEALGMPLEEAEQEWRAFLETVPLPPHAVPMARLRFERPALFGQICPHAIAALEQELSSSVDSGDNARTIENCDGILALDEGQAYVHAVRSGALARVGRMEEAEAELRALIGPPAAGTPVIVHAREEIADAAWQRGDIERARALYEANREVPQPNDGRRQIEVKLDALARPRGERDALVELLAPSPSRPHDGVSSMAAIARLSELSEDGLGDYLAARQLFVRQRYDLAQPLVERAIARGLSGQLVRIEAQRMRAITLYAVGQREASLAAWGAIRFEALATTGQEGRAVEAQDWLTRIRWAERNAHP